MLQEELLEKILCEKPGRDYAFRFYAFGVDCETCALFFAVLDHWCSVPISLEWEAVNNVTLYSDLFCSCLAALFRCLFLKEFSMLVLGFSSEFHLLNNLKEVFLMFTEFFDQRDSLSHCNYHYRNILILYLSICCFKVDFSTASVLTLSVVVIFFILIIY